MGQAGRLTVVGQTSKWMSHPKEATASQSQLSETREKGKPSVVSSFQILTR